MELDLPLNAIQTDRFQPVTTTAIRMEIKSTTSGAAASLYEFEAWTTQGDKSRNVALTSADATPSASSFALANQTRHFENLTDGAVDRRQDFPWVARDAGPAWIQIDFANPETIDRIVWDRGSSVPADYVVKTLVAADQNGSADDRWRVVVDTGGRWLREDDTRAAENVRLRGLSADDVKAVVQINAQIRAARAEVLRLTSGPQVFAASFSAPEATWLLGRGDPMNRRKIVDPAIPTILGNLGLNRDTPEHERRVALAQHLTTSNHPLTPRVIINRVWQHHFGEGLVDTPSDFGEMGSKPSHRKLLDELASGFVAGGWSLKNLHRQIVLSKTFRQSSRPRENGLKIDADSRLLWRFPPRRFEGEAIRDSILQCSGKLNWKMGGPGFDLFKQRGGLSDYISLETFDESGWRRMIYSHKIRMQSVDIFGAFDCPDSGQMKPKRSRSITPSQSLSLFNSPFVLRQAAFFADRVRSEAPGTSGEQVRRAFQIAFGRPPSNDEHNRMLQLVDSEGLQQLCRVLLNSSEFLYIQ